MNGENDLWNRHPRADVIRALDAFIVARLVDSGVRVILVNQDGLPLSDDEKRELNIRLGRNPEMGIGEDAPGN